jgi:hypothetical protein
LTRLNQDLVKDASYSPLSATEDPQEVLRDLNGFMRIQLVLRIYGVERAICLSWPRKTQRIIWTPILILKERFHAQAQLRRRTLFELNVYDMTASISSFAKIGSIHAPNTTTNVDDTPPRLLRQEA